MHAYTAIYHKPVLGGPTYVRLTMQGISFIAFLSQFSENQNTTTSIENEEHLD